MKPSLLLRRTDENIHLIDAPVLARQALIKGAIPLDSTNPMFAKVHLVKPRPHKEVFAALGCLINYVRRECGFGGLFDMDAEMLESCNYEVILLVEDAYDDNVLVVGLMMFSRLMGRQFNWELSVAYLLPSSRRKWKFSKFLDLAICRYGGFFVQHPLSSQMEQIVAKHKAAGRIGNEAYFSGPRPIAIEAIQ